MSIDKLDQVEWNRTDYSLFYLVLFDNWKISFLAENDMFTKIKSIGNILISIFVWF